MEQVLKDYSQCRLGRAILRAKSSEGFPDDFDWDYVSPDGLALRDAWAMATSWADELEGQVTLATDKTEELFAAIPNDEWIEVEIGCCGAQQAAAAHASSLVWRALAACRGYGASENPVFWRRLFYQLRRKGRSEEPSERVCTARKHLEPGEVTDAHQFFDGVVFPRFKVNLPIKAPFESVAACCRIFCGIEQPATDDGITVKLISILDRLRTVVNTRRLVETMEVALHLHPTLEEEPFVNELVSTIQRHCDTLDEGAHRDVLLQPLYRIPHLYVGIRSAHYHYDERELRRGSTMTTLIASRGVGGDYPLPFMRFLRWAICSDWSQSTECVGIRELQFFHNHDVSCIPAICASLPYTRSLETLHLASCDANWPNQLDEQDLAWIAYAIFHPDAATSSWRRLVFERLYYRSFTSGGATPTQVWELMARGNNLAVVLGHSTRVADAYYTATLKPGAVICSSTSHDDIVDVLERATEIDVCVTSTDLDTLDEWVMVVVVGYGEAWVQRHWIDRINARPRAPARLSALVFLGGSLEEAMDLPTLLRVAGQSLQCLDLHGLVASSVASIDPQLAEWCPQLSTLHFPLVKGDPPAFELPTSLRHIRIGAKPLSILRPLIQRNQDHLETMHVSTTALITETEVVECVIPLIRVLPRLRHCNWVELGAENWEEKKPLTYAMQRYFSREILKPMDLDGRDGFAIANTGVPTDTLVALLSVIVNGVVAGSAISGLSTEMVQLIGSFVGTLVRRTVWAAGTCKLTFAVNPEWQDPRRPRGSFLLSSRLAH